jgi:hypothetical protein
VVGSGFVEALYDVAPLRGHPGIGGHQEPRVVIDDVQDLHIGPVGEHDVGDVCLPPLVRELGLEPDEGALRSLLGLGGDEAPPGEDAPDRGGSGGAPAAGGEVEGDGVGPGVQASFIEVLPELHDLVLVLRGRPVGTARGAPGARLEPGLTLGIEPLDDLLDPPPGHPVVPGHLRLGPPQLLDRRDHQPPHRYRPPPSIEV